MNRTQSDAKPANVKSEKTETNSSPSYEKKSEIEINFGKSKII